MKKQNQSQPQKQSDIPVNRKQLSKCKDDNQTYQKIWTAREKLRSSIQKRNIKN